METRFQKQGNAMVPFDSGTIEWFERQADGKFFDCDISTPRNYRFHCKAFKLATIAFNYWKPSEITTEFGIVKKQFERFRELITIKAGYYSVVYDLDGNFELVADSWSFAKMDDENFGVFYDKLLTVIIQKVLVGMTIQEVDELVGGFL